MICLIQKETFLSAWLVRLYNLSNLFTRSADVVPFLIKVAFFFAALVCPLPAIYVNVGSYEC